MKTQFFSGYLIFLITVTGCTTSTKQPTSLSTPSPTTTATTPPLPTSTPTPTSVKLSPVSANFKISAEGMGPAKLGMTLGELKKQLGANAEFKVMSPYIVDFDAIAVSQNGKVQYYILYPAAKPLTDSDKIEYLLTENPAYRTEKGVGSGTTLKQAEAAYGDATLSYNTAIEGREYVSFANEPAKNIAFRLGSFGDNSLVGVYPSASGEFNQTKQYKDDGIIRAVRVDCQGQSCGN